MCVIAQPAVLSADNASDKSTWSTFWVKIWRGEPVNLRGQEALDYIRDRTVPLRDVFQSAIDWTPENSYVSVNEMNTWTPVPWDNHGGRVTLAGDAAHPMLICRLTTRAAAWRERLQIHIHGPY